MAEGIRREAVYLWYYFDLQLRQILPYFLLGVVLGSVISVFVKDRIHGLFRSLGDKRLGVLGVIPASILGIASPLCMYGTIPLAASFSRSGIRDDWLAAFMISSFRAFVSSGEPLGMLFSPFHGDIYGDSRTKRSALTAGWRNTKGNQPPTQDINHQSMLTSL